MLMATAVVGVGVELVEADVALLLDAADGLFVVVALT